MTTPWVLGGTATDLATLLARKATPLDFLASMELYAFALPAIIRGRLPGTIFGGAAAVAALQADVEAATGRPWNPLDVKDLGWDAVGAMVALILRYINKSRE
jgi:hypothetical protein